MRKCDGGVVREKPKIGVFVSLMRFQILLGKPFQFVVNLVKGIEWSYRGEAAKHPVK